MFRTIADFEKTWGHESADTLKILRALTDASLAQAVGPGLRTLGRLAWHLTLTLSEMADRTGLSVAGPDENAPPPARAAEVASAYEGAARSLLEQVRSRWTDASLLIEDEMYGEKWPRGYTLLALVAHQTHHRGQMTVLMRQAGLTVPGVYGPAKDEWGAFGMPVPEI